MYTISLGALLIVAAEAANYGGYSKYGGKYGGSSYGSYGKPSYYGKSSYPSKYGSSSKSSHSYQHPDYDETWYSKTMQYTKPKLMYKPATNKTTTYAICQFNADGDSIQLAQMPGQKLIIRWNVSALPEFNDAGDAWAADVPVTAVIQENNFCEGEFNPLDEKDFMGRRTNLFQDPTRGRIPSTVTTADGSDIGITDVTEKDICLNLSGPDSIMGRSISIQQLGEDGLGDGTSEGCCIIGYDLAPTGSVNTDHHHHKKSSYGGSYPSYGSGYGHGKYGPSKSYYGNKGGYGGYSKYGKY